MSQPTGTKEKGSGHKVMIVDEDSILNDKIIQALEESGFEVQQVRNGAQARRLLTTWSPDFMLYDFTMHDTNAVSFLQLLKRDDLLGADKIKFFVLSKEVSPYSMRESLRHGASDFLVKPVKPAELIQRLLLHIRAKRELPAFNPNLNESNSAQYYMYLTDLLLREALKDQPPAATLHRLTALTAISVNAVRVSTIGCDFESRKGWVFASSDKREINALEIDLFKYPEVLYVLRHEKILAIDNIAADETMQFVAKHTKEVQFKSMIVCPITIGGRVWGVLSARMSDAQKQLSDFQIRYTQLVAHTMGLVIRSDRALLEKPIAATTPAPESP